jgi:hypothetical protein
MKTVHLKVAVVSGCRILFGTLFLAGLIFLPRDSWANCHDGINVTTNATYPWGRENDTGYTCCNHDWMCITGQACMVDYAMECLPESTCAMGTYIYGYTYTIAACQCSNGLYTCPAGSGAYCDGTPTPAVSNGQTVCGGGELSYVCACGHYYSTGNHCTLHGTGSCGVCNDGTTNNCTGACSTDTVGKDDCASCSNNCECKSGNCNKGPYGTAPGMCSPAGVVRGSGCGCGSAGNTSCDNQCYGDPAGGVTTECGSCPHGDCDCGPGKSCKKGQCVASVTNLCTACSCDGECPIGNNCVAGYGGVKNCIPNTGSTGVANCSNVTCTTQCSSGHASSVGGNVQCTDPSYGAACNKNACTGDYNCGTSAGCNSVLCDGKCSGGVPADPGYGPCHSCSKPCECASGICTNGTCMASGSGVGCTQTNACSASASGTLGCNGTTCCTTATYTSQTNNAISCTAVSAPSVNAINLCSACTCDAQCQAGNGGSTSSCDPTAKVCVVTATYNKDCNTNTCTGATGGKYLCDGTCPNKTPANPDKTACQACPHGQCDCATGFTCTGGICVASGFGNPCSAKNNCGATVSGQTGCNGTTCCTAATYTSATSGVISCTAVTPPNACTACCSGSTACFNKVDLCNACTCDSQCVAGNGGTTSQCKNGICVAAITGNQCGCGLSGTYDCSGSCSGVKTNLDRCSTCTADCQCQTGDHCDATAHMCVPTNFGVKCGCGDSGNIQCDGTCNASISVNTTANCSTCHFDCECKSNLCDMTTSKCIDPKFNTECVSDKNTCGQTASSKYLCDGTCPAKVPDLPSGYAEDCDSPKNCIGEVNTGTGQCDGTCSALAPANPAPQKNCASCKYNCQCISNLCDTVNGKCVDSNFGHTCTSEANACGATQTGTYLCDGKSCSAGAPDNPLGYGKSCPTTGTNCIGQTGTGAADCNGNCIGSAPTDPPKQDACSPCAYDCQCKSGQCTDGKCVKSNYGKECSAGNGCQNALHGTYTCSGDCSVTAAPECAGQCCGDTCCPAGYGCEGSACKLPDGSSPVPFAPQSLPPGCPGT